MKRECLIALACLLVAFPASARSGQPAPAAADRRAGQGIGELGLRENTIVVVWGDHGFQLGAGPLAVLVLIGPAAILAVMFAVLSLALGATVLLKMGRARYLRVPRARLKCKMNAYRLSAAPGCAFKVLPTCARVFWDNGLLCQP